MANDGEKKTLVTNQKLMQMAEENAKRLSDLSNVIAVLQKSAEENAALTTSMVVNIQTNADKIDEIEKKSSKAEDMAKDNKIELATCMARILRLENKSRLVKEIDDQNAKIRTLYRKISPREMTKAACFVALHGLPLPEVTLSDAALAAVIAENISFSLGKELTKYIFATKDDLFTNIAGWFSRPGGDGHVYNKTSPEFARNTVIFSASSRIQAIHLETKIRSALISSQASRKSTDFEGLELGFFTDSAKVKALFKLMLYKGKILTGAIEQISHYRVSWRGGAKRNDPGSIPHLSLELKASKEYVNERTDYFFKDGQQIRNLWTEDDNILLSDLPNIWFARKPEQVRHAEEKLQQISNSTLEQTVKSPALTKKPADVNTEKRKRDSPGLAGNRSKEPHIDMDVNDINTIDEEDEERTSDSESNTRDEIVTTVVIENKDVNNEILPKQKGGGKVKSKITKPSLPKPVTDFPPLPSKPNTQKKISALFTPAGRKPSGPDSGLPAPVIPT